MRRAEEEEEFSAFVHAQSRPLFRTAYLLTGDISIAEDLVLDTLARVYPRWHRVVASEPPAAYALRLLLTETTTWWHRDRAHDLPRPPTVVESALVESARVEPAARGAVDSRVVWNVVLGLPPRQRAVVVLCYHEGLSEEEAADALGVAVGTVRHLVRAADRRLAADRHLLAALAPADTAEQAAEARRSS